MQQTQILLRMARKNSVTLLMLSAGNNLEKCIFFLFKKNQIHLFFLYSKSSTLNLYSSNLNQHIRTLGSMQPGSVDFVSNVLPHTYDSKPNTTVSSSSSGYESVKSHRSFFSRLKRFINFPSNKKSSNYQISTLNHSYEQTPNSPNLSSTGFNQQSNEHRRNSLTRLDIRRKSSRRTLQNSTQHIPFLYGLKNCGNTW